MRSIFIHPLKIDAWCVFHRKWGQQKKRVYHIFNGTCNKHHKPGNLTLSLLNLWRRIHCMCNSRKKKQKKNWERQNCESRTTHCVWMVPCTRFIDNISSNYVNEFEMCSRNVLLNGSIGGFKIFFSYANDSIIANDSLNPKTLANGSLDLWLKWKEPETTDLEECLIFGSPRIKWKFVSKLLSAKSYFTFAKYNSTHGQGKEISSKTIAIFAWPPVSTNTCLKITCFATHSWALHLSALASHVPRAFSLRQFGIAPCAWGATLFKA